MSNSADRTDAHRASQLSYDASSVNVRSGWKGDIVCLSHLRWGFVYQRPNHLMARFARRQRVFFVEEPVYDAMEPYMETRLSPEAVIVCVPHLPGDTDALRSAELMGELFREFRNERRMDIEVLWFYTPMALEWARHEVARVIVYDCMDELSALIGAPKALSTLELELFSLADVVFTAGQSLFEAKRRLHPSVHAFPSSVDAAHFAKARRAGFRDGPPWLEPDDQAGMPHPRLGFFGVIDERVDLELLEGLGRARPDWQIVLLGPLVKIDPASLPQSPNIHWLGTKSYNQLPEYIAGWDVAIMPFALNAATRFISPIKTLEYLAAGRPVVSTAVPDVVNPFAGLQLVRIADAATFVAAVSAALAQPQEQHWRRADRYIELTSWDRTWQAMADLVDWRTSGGQVERARLDA